MCVKWAGLVRNGSGRPPTWKKKRCFPPNIVFTDLWLVTHHERFGSVGKNPFHQGNVASGSTGYADMDN